MNSDRRVVDFVGNTRSGALYNLDKGPKIFEGLSPIQTGAGGGGILEPAPSLKICHFQTVKAMTTKFGDFS